MENIDLYKLLGSSAAGLFQSNPNPYANPGQAAQAGAQKGGSIGALLGAGVGSFIPGVGTAVGGHIGSTLGKLLGGNSAQKKAETLSIHRNRKQEYFKSIYEGF